jgi:predicted tellurium resistance membrane protein TerC
LIMALLERFPILVWAGAALLGWIVGDTIATDPVIKDYLLPRLGPEEYHYATWAAGLIGAILVLIVGGLWRRSKQGGAQDNKQGAAQEKVSAAE